ncbi:ribosome silencing factor [bacterium (Candidatus Blackallbacteria) CG17_big_fil_post_rev_8_21_14_2_50_48_46]|uniref:Ribosomal silencing factor RsfS n=1 Tax=bacterium (Candidatus Blackallbacteria) CG17_big_fil_post_rev_8_21_14_2_50_48_46 TaxID=2014261 RepID=A0A2M7G106_9BACT|nr:MAG: ribosome silencing factor [bacterium (Candidatus Blackallbacteria) CG18_big_fil_WC_8_21_14_2_50_49_26]PIW15385.1 MAG: ribosome silencing factor [bacterium (Candidatus Blackallbacteria) CG17_big_fil_post_rev_8_21_14_2_50_48_46]PIW49754.1 MAG: ribosome silencing factor [bacterium (Candidatus Blackallbacteria) CG13_big_fil_rev_8_21_14_2_50_49_14]
MSENQIQAPQNLLTDSDVALHLKAIQELLEEKKALDLATLDLREKSSVADYFLVAGANSRTHCQALAGTVDQYAKEQNLHVYSNEGKSEGSWILIDLGFMVVHVMQESQRVFYNLEELWSHATQKT